MRAVPMVDLRAAFLRRVDAALAHLQAELAPDGDLLLAVPRDLNADADDTVIRSEALDAWAFRISTERYEHPRMSTRWAAVGTNPPGLDLPLSVRAALDLVAREREAVAVNMAGEVERCARELVDPALLAAVLTRPDVVKRWPWNGDTAAGYAMSLLLSALATAAPDEEMAAMDWSRADGFDGYWPGEAAPLEVAKWSRDGLNRAAMRAHVSPAQRSTGYTPRPGDDRERWSRSGPFTDWTLVDAEGARERYPAAGIALLYLAEREARESGRVPVLRLSASAASRAALAVLSAGTLERGRWDDDATRVSRAEGWAELVWNGRPRHLQLRLNFRDSEVVAAAVVHGILAELQEDGVRDWLTLHRMAAEQGATGKVRWTWAEHRARTAYDRLIRTKNATEAELAAGVVDRLQRMKSAELRWNVSTEGGKYAWARIGPFGLIDIPAGGGVLAGREQRVAKIELNPVIYEGAARGSKTPHFALLPERALELPGPQLRLLAHLFLDFTYAGEVEGVSRKAGTLWGYAGIKAGENTPRKRWPDATRALARALDAVGDAVGWDWSSDAGEHPDTLYRIRPPAWWTDRVLRGVPADYGPSLASVPRTGAELKAWRTARGLSQREVAALVGVSQPTILRAEKRAEAALDADLAAALAPGAIQKGSTLGPLDSER